MHELSAATSVVRTVLMAAEGKGVKRIRRVKVEVGELTLLNPEQLEFCFGIAAKDTIADGAKLEISVKPAVLVCSKCGSRISWSSPGDDPALHLIPPMVQCECGSTSLKVVSGRELSVLSMTVEQEEKERAEAPASS